MSSNLKDLNIKKNDETYLNIEKSIDFIDAEGEEEENELKKNEESKHCIKFNKIVEQK